MGKLALSIAYVIPLALIVWLWVGNRLNRVGRIGLLLALPLIYWFHWYSILQSLGWPTEALLPDRFELIGADVIEPNQQKNIDGSIYLWVRQKDTQQPRAYVLPYSRELHKLLFQSKKKMKQGSAQIGSTRGRESSGKGVSLGNNQRLIFQDVPRSRLPRKKQL